MNLKELEQHLKKWFDNNTDGDLFLYDDEKITDFKADLGHYEIESDKQQGLTKTFATTAIWLKKHTVSGKPIVDITIETFERTSETRHTFDYSGKELRQLTEKEIALEDGTLEEE